jgi:hypothetical protein
MQTFALVGAAVGAGVTISSTAARTTRLKSSALVAVLPPGGAHKKYITGYPPTFEMVSPSLWQSVS